MKPKLIFSLAFVLISVVTGYSADSTRAGSRREISTNDWQTKSIASEADLDKAIGQLQNPKTRFAALQVLLEFAGCSKDVWNDDLKVNDLHKKAMNAMYGCPNLDAVVELMIDRLNQPENRMPMLRGLIEFWPRSSGGVSIERAGICNPSGKLITKVHHAVDDAFDVLTVERAMADPDRLVRLYAVYHVRISPVDRSEWNHLLPQLEKLALTDDAGIRAAAIQKIQWFPSSVKFLSEQKTKETSPEVLLQLVQTNEFLTYFVPLLSHPDEKVREDALWFVAMNQYSAPMWQISFGKDVFEKAVSSTKAPSGQERTAAIAALTCIRQLDLDRSREIFLGLANDPAETVRLRIAWGLVGQFERTDVKQVIDALLKDESPKVRFYTIVAFGPQKCMAELEQLSKVSDAHIAEMATDRLKQLASNSSR